MSLGFRFRSDPHSLQLYIVNAISLMLLLSIVSSSSYFFFVRNFLRKRVSSVSAVGTDSYFLPVSNCANGLSVI